jgi:hypothetical protein
MFGSMEAFIKGVVPLIRNACKYSTKGTQGLLAFHLEKDQRAPEQMSRSSTASISYPLASCTRSGSDPSSPFSSRERSDSDLDVSDLHSAVVLSRSRVSLVPVDESMITPSANTFLSCSVLDRDSGLRPSMISKMAAGSIQLDVSSTRHTEAGIGFELCIAKLIAEQVGVQLSVQSKSASFVSPSPSSQYSRAPSPEDHVVGAADISLQPFVCASGQSSCVSSNVCRHCEEAFAQSATTCFSFSMPVAAVTFLSMSAEEELDDSEPFLDLLKQKALVSAPAF